MTRPPIVLLTDFGLSDPFAGIMKGVIARIAPGVPILDLTHEISPGDIAQGAVHLWQAVDYFPDDSVFVAVVDPGVGTSRRGLVTTAGRHLFVGPDNGIFSFVSPRSAPAYALENPRYALPDPGATFHGRDIFAPAAAFLASGIPPQAFGPPIQDPTRLPTPHLAWASPTQLDGEILHQDRFGNLLTSLGRLSSRQGEVQVEPWLDEGKPGVLSSEGLRLRLPIGHSLARASTFGEVPEGECAWLIGSSGLVEIAANGRSAADLTGLARGDRVSLTATSS